MLDIVLCPSSMPGSVSLFLLGWNIACVIIVLFPGSNGLQERICLSNSFFCSDMLLWWIFRRWISHNEKGYKRLFPASPHCLYLHHSYKAVLCWSHMDPKCKLLEKSPPAVFRFTIHIKLVACLALPPWLYLNVHILGHPTSSDWFLSSSSVRTVLYFFLGFLHNGARSYPQPVGMLAYVLRLVNGSLSCF